MPLDPKERNVNPLLVQTGIRTVKRLVLTLAIHDKNVTLAKTAQVSFTVRTGRALAIEDSLGAEAYRHIKLCLPTPSKQWLIIAMPSFTRIPFPMKVHVRGSRQIPSAHQDFIRDAIALHTVAGSGQHRPPVCGPIAVPRPYAYEQVHEESQGPPTLCGTILSLPSLLQRREQERFRVSGGHPKTTKAPTFLFSPPGSTQSSF